MNRDIPSLTGENPWQFINENVVQCIRIIVFECVDHLFGVVQIEIGHSCVGQIEDQRNQIVLFLALHAFNPIDEHTQQLLGISEAAEVQFRFDDEHRFAVFVAIVWKYDANVDIIHVNIVNGDV